MGEMKKRVKKFLYSLKLYAREYSISERLDRQFQRNLDSMSIDHICKVAHRCEVMLRVLLVLEALDLAVSVLSRFI
jgi:hypothetical protein